jgi:sirohydrochlorin ferrochelatase
VTRPLVLVAHGSRDAAATATVESLVRAVRRRREGLAVTAAYLDHTEPRVPAAVESVGPGAVVVPLLLTAAFHSRVDLPAQLAAADPAAVQAAVLGPHPLLVAALERRLAESGVGTGDPGTAVVLAAAGSADAGARDTVHRLAAGWASRGWWGVGAAFASGGAPRVGEAVRALRRRGAPRVAVASYLLAPGLFADRVATDAVTAGAAAVGAPLADAPEVADLALLRYDGALLAAPVASIEA